MGPEVSADYIFTRDPDTLIFNDTLTFRPASEWTPGSKSLTIDLNDDSGNPTNLILSWYVFAPGQPVTPDFAASGPYGAGGCLDGLNCGQRWFLPFALQFSGTGGVPPYTWSTGSATTAPPPLPFPQLSWSTSPPAYDVGLFQFTGTFTGGPTFCFLCSFYFNVCVADSLGTRTCHDFQFHSGL